MDDIVIAAIRKWPNVPAVYGWLALDARGDWYLRDEAVQAHAPFPQLKGSRIEHVRLIEFIGRNYLADEHGAWFFQNGPQRVYVELEAAPLVAGVERRGDEFLLTSHVGHILGAGLCSALGNQLGSRPGEQSGNQQHRQPGRPEACLLDEAGRLFVASPAGLAIVRSTDMLTAADALELGVWPAPQEVVFADLAARFGHQLQPVPVNPTPA